MGVFYLENQMATTVLPLNHGQDAAAEGFFKFLFEPESELIISGPGGVGKTFLMGHLIDNILPRYFQMCELMGTSAVFRDVVMTATTNKAAEVLGQQTGRPTETIQSYLNLRVVDDYATGVSRLEKTTKWRIHHNSIIFVDEASMIDNQLLTKIREGTNNCKIIFVGDHCQLAPIKEPISPIYRQRLPFFELIEPMRNNGQPALMALCKQLRNTVETNEFFPIKTVPGVIDHLSGIDLQAVIDNTFHVLDNDARLLAYTNNRVTQFNDYIRDLRSVKEQYVIGETLINNSAIQLSNGMLSVELEVKIEDLSSMTHQVEIEDGVFLEVVYATISTPYLTTFSNVMLPVDKAHLASLIKYYQKAKNWNRYYYLKNTFPDLRQKDVSTVHKSQGSTYGTVLIDLENLSTCHNPNQVARMLYVAVSRASHRIVMFGKLASKYGKVI